MKEKLIDALKTPVKQGSVVVLVIERIKEALMNRELKPGDYLPSETELTRSLGVGKTTVREAIKMLQAMGVVEVKRGQGTIIREHPEESVLNPLIFQLVLQQGENQDIIELRKMFEPAYTLMAMENATEEDIERIRQTIERLQNAVEQGIPQAEDDLAFHHAILQSTHNPFVIRIGETILQLFKISISRSMRTIPEIALHDHRQIFEAFCAKEEQKLHDAIIKSFEGWKQSLEIEKALR